MPRMSKKRKQADIAYEARNLYLGKSEPDH